ncbi:cysteine synthase A [Amaricoccus macauensis]|uniref:cysteine synthase A n=1 Tax=Amaricoccus macauensis TaxID=57001 RepID=UPI003C7A5A87
MPRAPRGRIFDDITETIGGTPIVRLSRMTRAAGLEADILAKLEFFNPTSSVKDRIGVAMIDALEADGSLRPGGTVVEPTSGNTGIGLAFVCAARGYKLVLTMPENMSAERRKMLLLFGARIELTPADKGMAGAIARANELLEEIPGAVMPQQFDNPANPAIHAATTAREILADTGGALDVFVCGVGTGGTLTGVAQVIRAECPNVEIIAVEPEDSPVLSGGEAGPHCIQGIGAGFVPSVLNRGAIDRVLTIGNRTAIETARKLAEIEGISGGISCGAAVAAALEIASEPGMGAKRILAILPSYAERYLSTSLFEPI